MQTHAIFQLQLFNLVRRDSRGTEVLPRDNGGLFHKTVRHRTAQRVFVMTFLNGTGSRLVSTTRSLSFWGGAISLIRSRISSDRRCRGRRLRRPAIAFNVLIHFGGSGNFPRRFVFKGNVGVLLYLPNCYRIIDSLITVRAFIKLNVRCGVSLAVSSAGDGFMHFL